MFNHTSSKQCVFITLLSLFITLVWGLIDYSSVLNKHTSTFINFWNFFQGLLTYYGFKRLKFYYISLHILRGYVYFFLSNFPERLRLFKGVRLFQTLEYAVFMLLKVLSCHCIYNENKTEKSTVQ